MRHLMLAAALLIAPLVASAQPKPVFTFNGCDSSYSNVFGSGPRLCARGTVLESLTGVDPGHQLFRVEDFVISASTGWSERTIGYDSFLFVTSVGPFDSGSEVVPACQIGAVCRGTAIALAQATDYAPAGASLLALTLRVRYYPDSVPTGFTGYTGPTYDSDIAFGLTAVPEPAPLALTAAAVGGLAMLSVGTRRRRRTSDHS